MCQEHKSTETFTSQNYGITTSPAQEWETIIRRDKSKEVHHRIIPDFKELLERETAKASSERVVDASEQESPQPTVRLTKEEIIAVILYTGPMVIEQHPMPATSPSTR